LVNKSRDITQQIPKRRFMMKKEFKTLVSLAAFLLLMGCSAHASMEVRSTATASGKAHAKTSTSEPAKEPTKVVATPPEPAEPAEPVVAKPPFEYTLAEGGAISQTACPNKPEELNGIDDDCDGQVDEDWVKSGPLQITLWWEGDPDLDLAVTDPKGHTINVKNRKGKAGGAMDKDSRSACKGGETIENIYWTGDPAKGTYKVDVKYYSSCGHKDNPPQIQANVAISYNGQFFGPFVKSMNSKEEATVIQFVLE
jgi:hypothetical protein